MAISDEIEVWYFLDEQGKESGPHHREDMIRWWRAGQLTVESLVWAPGMQEWTSFRSAFQALLPPPPPEQFAGAPSPAPIPDTSPTSGVKSAKPKRNWLAFFAVVVAALLLRFFIDNIVRYNFHFLPSTLSVGEFAETFGFSLVPLLISAFVFARFGTLAAAMTALLVIGSLSFLQLQNDLRRDSRIAKAEAAPTRIPQATNADEATPPASRTAIAEVAAPSVSRLASEELPGRPFSLPSDSRTEWVTAVDRVATAPITIEGKIEYGCGGTTGTMCYLVATKSGELYMISMLFDTTFSAADMLRTAKDSNKCVGVTGKISSEKLGVFFVFDDRYAIRLHYCGRPYSLLQYVSRVDWFDVGGTRLVVPTPSGSALVTPEMTKLAEFLRSFVPATTQGIAEYIIESELPAALMGNMPALDRRYAVSISKGVIDVPISPALFAEMKHPFKATIEESRNLIEGPADYSEMLENAQRIYDTDVAINSIGTIHLTPHAESDRTLSYSSVITAKAENRTAVTVLTSTYLLVKDRLLLLEVYGGKEDLEWTREKAKEWADTIINANTSPKSL